MKTLHKKLLKNISPVEVLKISQGHFAVCTWLVGKCWPDLTCSQSQSLAHNLEDTILSWGVVDLEGARTELGRALNLTFIFPPLKAMHGPFKSEYSYCNQIEREELNTIGPIWVYWLGQENVYFVSVRTGVWHYCKCL